MAELIGVPCLARDEPLLARLEREPYPSLTTTMEKSLPLSWRFNRSRAGALDRHRLLGDEDHVRAACDSAHHRDPARMPAMTSTTMTRLCDSAVVWSRSIASVAIVAPCRIQTT